MRVWLASGSQRRSEMLKHLCQDLYCKGLDSVDETSNAENVSEQVMEICRKKAGSVDKNVNFDLVVVSDTMLQDPDLDSKAIGKPKDAIDAASMLHRLSGRRHRVWTATGILFQNKWKFYLNQSIVEFEDLSDEVLVDLVLNNSWVGKAGGYDLAGEMGRYAKLVDGDESTVLGIAEDAMVIMQGLFG